MASADDPTDPLGATVRIEEARARVAETQQHVTRVMRAVVPVGVVIALGVWTFVIGWAISDNNNHDPRPAKANDREQAAGAKTDPTTTTTTTTTPEPSPSPAPVVDMPATTSPAPAPVVEPPPAPLTRSELAQLPGPLGQLTKYLSER